MSPGALIGAGVISTGMWAGIIYVGYKVWDHPVGNTALRTAARILIPG